MPLLKKLLTNFTKGELSPHVEGRPDLAAFYNGVKILENFLIFPEGGIFRAPGTIFIGEAKDSSKKARLIPFKFNIEQAYAIEAGHQYFRFYRRGYGVSNNAFVRIENPAGTPVEIATPYSENDLAELQWVQSADVLYIDHPNYQGRKLSRVSDISWALSLFNANPPPSFEDDTDISGTAATLTPGATTGTGITFTASSAVFLKADVGRQIIFGASRAVIIQLGPSAGSPSPNAVVKADILDDFPNTDPIPAGSWLLRLSPQVALDPNIKEPVGAQITLTCTGTDAFRSADLNKFIKIYGGLVKLTQIVSAQNVKGQILSILKDATTADPAAAPAGSWSLEVPSWSDSRGWPSANEFHQGRHWKAATKKQPTTKWGSQSDSYENFAIGSDAADAVEYTIANRSVNVLEWLKSLGQLFIGDAENEHAAKGPGVDQPLGGDVVPFIQDQSAIGSMSTMAQIVWDAILFIQTYGKKVLQLAYNLEKDSYSPLNLTLFSRHICEPGLAQHPMVYQKEPNSILYFIRSDGQMPALTFYRDEQVAGWSRIKTDGLIESACSIPNRGDGFDDLVLLVNRTINGQTKRYIEPMEQKSLTVVSRKWREFYTHSAIAGKTASATATITGLPHLEGKQVDVVTNVESAAAKAGSYKGRYTVSGGQIILPEALPADTEYEVGLPYTSKLVTMRPAMADIVVEFLKRRWVKVFLRLLNSIYAKVNGDEMIFDIGGQPLDEGPQPFTGDKEAKGTDWDLDGYVTIETDKPLPLTIVAVGGTVEFADTM